MSELSYDIWTPAGGSPVTFGHNGTTQVYGLTRTDGLDDRDFDISSLVGGFDGGTQSSSFAEPRAWIDVLDLSAANGAGWQDLRDDLMRATASSAVGTYEIHHRDDVWTLFARVTTRTIPRDANAMERHYGEAQVGFETADPMAYGPTDDITFTGTSDSEIIDSPGWSDSYRWKWVVPGPVTNPQISSSLDSSAVIRYVGSVGSTDNLVVELFPRGQVPGYIAKIVADADLAHYATTGIGDPAYGDLDGGAYGSARPPQWFPIPGGEQTISYASTSGSGGSTFTWRPGFG